MEYAVPQTQSPFATEPIGRLIVKFAVPSVIALLVNSLYNIVDQIFIGWGVGYLGNGATNIVFPITIIALALSMMIGNGGAAYLSLKMGEGEVETAKKGVGQRRHPGNHRQHSAGCDLFGLDRPHPDAVRCNRCAASLCAGIRLYHRCRTAVHDDFGSHQLDDPRRRKSKICHAFDGHWRHHQRNPRPGFHPLSFRWGSRGQRLQPSSVR